MLNAESTSLTVLERVALALNSEAVKQEFIALAEESKTITAIVDKTSYDECHSARMRLVKARINTTKRGKDAREDAQAFAKGVIAGEKMLLSLIAPEEDRLEKLQADWDAIKEQKRQAEADRIAKQQERVEAIKSIPLSLVGKSAATIADVLEKTKTTIDLTSFEEFSEFAAAAFETTVAALDQLHAGAVAQEKAAAEAAEVARRDAEELAKLRAEQEERKRTEAARVEAARVQQEGIERAARAKMEAAEAASRVRIAEEERVAREAREAEEQRLSKERAEREEAQAKEDARLKAQRDELEAKQREVQRQADELLSGAEMLRTFIDRFGRRKEFEQVVAAIRVYLQAQPKQRKAA